MRWQWATALMTALAVAGGAHAVDETVRFKQDRFALVVFSDVAPSQDVEAAYQGIADANFTVVLVSGDDEEMMRKMDLCQQHGMAAITLQMKAKPEDYLEHPVCWGYGIRDEPSVEAFPELTPLVDAVHELYPGRLGLINLFPSYAAPWAQLGAENYEEYVRIFMEQCDVDVLSMDNYPKFRPGEEDGRDVYCDDLAVMRRHSLKKGIPFWNCFNIQPYSSQTNPTEDQVRWQMHASVAYGAKGLIYFRYASTRGPAGKGPFEFPKGGAVITEEGRRTRHYEQSKRLNFELKNLGPTLMKLTSTKVIRITPEDEPKEMLEGSPLVDLHRARYDPRHNMLVGAFEHEDGRRAVFLMNYHFAYTAWPTVAFDAPEEDVVEVSPETGREVPLVDDSPGGEGMQISLDAGQGRLFLLPGKG